LCHFVRDFLFHLTVLSSSWWYPLGCLLRRLIVLKMKYKSSLDKYRVKTV
jgi:hypothetical protein